MSPEQVRSAKHVDGRTDVWSLGMTLWTLLAGRAALDDIAALSELLVAICAQPIPWLQDSAPWVEPALARVVHSALLADLSARCPSIDALILALQPFAGGSEELHESDLAVASAFDRATAAPRATAATSWLEVIQSSTALAATVDSESPAILTPALEQLVGVTLGGRYTLERVLGAGGAGAVYRARCGGETVAVKVLLQDREERKPEALRRFAREAKTTTAIDSPHVVRVLDVEPDLERGFPFIVMELLSGIDLDQLLKQRGAIEAAPLVQAFVQACKGIAAAHACSIVHRDIKPANIFLHQHPDGRVEVKICDFGIAKNVAVGELDKTSTALTQTRGLLGSPSYMSPEQARSAKQVDHTTDIWSLGVSLYQGLAGHIAWKDASTIGDLIISICTEEIPPLTQVAPWVEPGLAAVVHRALERKPSARYASAEAFRSALEPYAAPGALRMESLVPVSPASRASAPAVAFATTTQQPVSDDASRSAELRPPPTRRPLYVGMAAALGALGVAGLFAGRWTGGAAAVHSPLVTADPTVAVSSLASGSASASAAALPSALTLMNADDATAPTSASAVPATSALKGVARPTVRTGATPPVAPTPVAPPAPTPAPSILPARF